MRRYFKRTDADSPFHDGPPLGSFFVEYDGELPKRQVEVYGERWLSSRREYHPGVGPGLTDIALSENLSSGGLGPQWEISAEEFEAAWEEADKHGA